VTNGIRIGRGFFSIDAVRRTHLILSNKRTGFFEDYFDGKDEALSKFWHAITKQLSEAA